MADVVVVSGVVDPELRAALTDASVSFLDEAGNCNIGVAGRFFISIEGRKLPELPPVPKGMRSAGYRALFALLIEPDLINASLREFAARAGVSTTSAAALLHTLRAEGSVATVKGKAQLRLNEGLVQRWLVGYRDVVRPWLFIGRYEAPPGGRATLTQILDGRFPGGWRWGGALADEMLGGHLRDAHTTVHLNVWLRKAFPRVPLRPSPDGEITVLGVPGPLAMPAHLASVHPLLVYSELSIESDPRSREASAALLERHRITGAP